MITVLHEIWLAAGRWEIMNIMSLSDALLNWEKQAKLFWSQKSQIIPLRFLMFYQTFYSNILWYLWKPKEYVLNKTFR